MALPDSRNETATAASQVKANTINDLQDCVIARRHGELEFGINANGFVPQANASYTTGPDLTFTGAGSAGHSLAYLPAGTVITTVEWTYNRAGVGSASGRLQRRPKAGGAAVDIQTFTDNDGAATESRTETYNHVIAAGFWYQLVFVAGASGNVLHGATLKAKK